MGRYDYDDMPSKNNSRGGKGNRRTALATVFFILVALIVLVIYLIANPQESVSVTQKDRKTGSLSSSSSNVETENAEKSRLITLAPAEEEDAKITGSAETKEENTPAGETEAETADPVEEEINPQRAEETVIEEAVTLQDNSQDRAPVSDETISIEEKRVEDETPVIEEELVLEEITSQESTASAEEETITEEDTPVIEEEIVVGEITSQEATASTEEETVPAYEVTVPEDEGPVIEEEIVFEDISALEAAASNEEERVPAYEVTVTEDEGPVIEEEITLSHETMTEEIAEAESGREEESLVEESVPETTLEALGTEAEHLLETASEETVYAGEANLLFRVDPDSVVSGGEAHFEDGVLVIKGKNGSAVRAVCAGTVTKTGRDNGLKYVVVTDDEGVGIRYTGFERVLVKTESRVKDSSVLGSIGSSTASTIRLSIEDDV